MAVITELWTGRRGDFNDQAVRKYTRVFRVFFASGLEGPLDVVNLAGLPHAGDPYVGASGETDPDAWCRTAQPTQDADDPRYWTVTYEYSSETADNQDQGAASNQTGNGGSGGMPRDPMQRSPVVRWGKQNFSRAVEVDTLTLKPICNSSGEPFDPPPEVEQAYLTLSIVRNEANYDPDKALRYTNAVNDAAWTVAGKNFVADEARCLGITADLKFEQGAIFWSVAYEFVFNKVDFLGPEIRGGWTMRIADRGHYSQQNGKFNFADPTSSQNPLPGDLSASKPKKPRDALDGSILGGIIFLDGNGAPLEIGAKPVYLPFSVYRYEDFSALNL